MSSSFLATPGSSVATSLPPSIWTASNSSSNIHISLPKIVKEYINTTINLNPQGWPLEIDTGKRKLVLLVGGGNILGVAKRYGRSFRILTCQPNYEGQQPADRVKRYNNTPLYLHSEATRQRDEKVIVFQNDGRILYEIRAGPENSYEKYCTNRATGEDIAMWKYRQQRNRVEIFQNDRGNNTERGEAGTDVGLIILLVIISDRFELTLQGTKHL